MARRRAATASAAAAVAASATVCALLVLAAPEAVAQGCSMCRTAVEGMDDPLARSLSRSVLFMVSMPFAVVASIAGWLFFTYRRGEGAPELRSGRPRGGAPSRPHEDERSESGRSQT